MALSPVDIDPNDVGPSSPTPLEPAETLSDNDVVRLSLQHPTPELNDHDVQRLSKGDFNIDVAGPAPETRAGLAAMQNKLQFESEYQPPTSLTPEGTNPRIQYPRGEVTRNNFLEDTAAQVGLGVLQAGAELNKQVSGIESAFGNEDAQHRAEMMGAVNRGLEEVGREAGGLPLTRAITSNIISTGPQLLTGAVGGLPAIATTFGLTAAGSATADAKEQGYEHPEIYGLLSGLIAAGTSLIPGYKGRNMVAAASEMVNSPSWKAYFQQLVNQYGTGKLLATHGGSTALMMATQSTLQSLLDKATINPNLQWSDVIVNAAAAAGLGSLIGEGFGALGQAAHLSTQKQQLNPILSHWIDQINSSQLVTEGLKPNEQRIPYTNHAATPPENLEPERPVPASMYPQPKPTGPTVGSLRPRRSTRGPQPAVPVPETPVFNRPDVLSPEEQAAAQAELTRPAPAALVPPVQDQAQLQYEVGVEQGHVPTLPAGQTPIIIQRADGTKYLGAFGGYWDQLPGQPAVISRVKDDAWSTAALEKGEKILTPVPPPKAPAPLPPTKPVEPAPVVAPPSKLPEWTAHEITRLNENAERLGIADKIEQLSLQRLTANQIAKQLGVEQDTVRAVRSVRSIPSMDDKTAFEQWVKSKTLKQAGSLIIKAKPAPAPLQSAPAGTLPKKGEQVTIGDFIIRRNKQGRITITTEETGAKSLAVLRKEDPAALDEKAILHDIVATQRGERTKYWDVKELRGSVSRGVKEVAEEQLYADPMKLAQDVVRELNKGPQDAAIIRTIQTGAMTPELLNAMVSVPVAKRGPKAIVAELRKQLAKGVQDYLNGDLLERTEPGKAGEAPREIFKTTKEKQDDGSWKEIPTDEEMKPEEIKKLFPTEKDLAGRVLQIMLGNKQVELELTKQIRSAPPEAKTEGTGEEDFAKGGIAATKEASALEPVDKSGMYHGEEVTKFEDSDLSTPQKLKAAELANEIKEEVLNGDVGRYDKGVEILQKVFGFTEAKAKDWMDSESTFLSPYHRRTVGISFNGNFDLSQLPLAPDKQGFFNGHQLVSTLKNNLHPTEWEFYKQRGIEEALGGKRVSDLQVLDWLEENGPKVKVRKFGEGAIPDWQKRYNQLTHQEYDSYSQPDRYKINEAVRDFPSGGDKTVDNLLSMLTIEKESVQGKRLREYVQLASKAMTDRVTQELEAPLTTTPVSGKPRTATQEDFRDRDMFSMYRDMGLLEPNPFKALQLLARGDGQYAALAKAFLEAHSQELEKVRLVNLGGTKAPASYNFDTNTVKISPDTAELDPGNIDQHFLHEVAHALLVRRVETLPENHPLIQELDRIFEEARQHLSDDRMVNYALQDRHEMMVMALTNPETQAHLEMARDPQTNLSLWQRFKNWVKQIIFGERPDLLQSTNTLIDRILDLPPIGNVEWLERRSFDRIGGNEITSTKNYPEIRNRKQYTEATEFQKDYTPQEEKEVLTRKAIANNNWLEANDVKAILDGVPDNAKGLLKSIVGERLDLVRQAQGEPGGNKPSTLRAILADPTLTDDRKSEISLSVLHNLLWFRRKADVMASRTERAIDELADRLDKLDKGLNEQTLKVRSLETALETITDEFKESVIKEKQGAKDQETVDQLNRMIGLADEIKGNRRTAMSKFLDALSDKIDLETLLSTEDPKVLLELIKKEFPVNSEVARSVGASEETMRIGSILMARSNSLREQLLSMKLLGDEKFRRGILGLNREVNDQLRQKNFNQVINQFANKLTTIATRRHREEAVYAQLFKEKLNKLRNIGKLSIASKALKDIQGTKSFKDLDLLVSQQNALMRPMAVFLDSGQIRYTHPLTRQPIDIGMSFERDGEVENYLKLNDLANAARVYLANPRSPNYHVPEAAFWRQFLRNTAVLLDPTVTYNAQKIVQAPYDPYRIVKVTGSLFMIPDQLLRRVGGRAAVDLLAGMQAWAAVDSQLGNLKKKWDAPLSRTANDAALAHKMPIEQWHDEVLNPLIASRQTTGYEPLKPGGKTLYGHEILPEDERAFQTQKAFDRQLVEIAQSAHGNPAVEFDPAKITFETPAGTPMHRQVMSSGPDTMSRRIDPATYSLATQWFNDNSRAARTQLMDNNFGQVVMGHLYTVGAPDYSIKSVIGDLYKEAIKYHRTVAPIESTSELLDQLFDAQTRKVSTNQQMSRDQLFDQLTKELSSAFKNVSGASRTTPKPEVGALLRIVDTDNSFTNARGMLVAPTTFYNYGLTFDGQRIGRLHSAKAYYTMLVAGKNGLLDRLIASVEATNSKFRSDIAQQVKAGVPGGKAARQVEAAAKQKQIDGDLLLTYQQSHAALRDLNKLKAQIVRMLTRTGEANDPDARQLYSSIQSFVVANLLAGTAQVTNAFGGVGNLMAVDKLLLDRSTLRSLTQIAMRTMLTKGPTEIATLLSKIVDPSNKWLLDTMRSPVAKPVFGHLADVIEARMDLHRQMEEVGLAPAANVRQDMRAILEMPGSGGRPQPSNPTLVQKAARRIETATGLVGVPLSAMAPRLVDRFINELTVWKAQDIEDMLRMNAAKFAPILEAQGLHGNTFQPEAVFGRKINAKHDILLRQVLERERISLDNVMWRYWDAYKQAQDKDSVQFFTPGERAAFQFSLAQDINLPTFANRPLSSKGSIGRNIAGIFWGFPAWQAGRISDFFAKASTDPSARKYLPQVLAIGLAMAVVGAASVKVTSELKDLFYGEKTGYPDLFTANNPNDALLALTVGLSSFVPFLGNLVNNIILNQPGRNAFDLNSQFVMLNFANDIYQTTKRIIQSHDIARPLEDFMRRWSPLARILVNKLPNEEGLTDYYNLTRELKSIAPDSMESKKKGMTGSFDATPVTPMLQSMVNDAYRGDTAGFMQAAQDYIKYKMDNDKLPEDQAWAALRSAWRSRHPMAREFGRMPTEGEEAIIYGNATPEQRASIDKANAIFQTYGELIGSNINVVQEPRSATGGLPSMAGGARSGSGAAGAGIPNVTGSLRVPGTGGSVGGGGNVFASNQSVFPQTANIFGGGGASRSVAGGGGGGGFRGPRKAVPGRGRGSLKLGGGGRHGIKIEKEAKVKVSAPAGRSSKVKKAGSLVIKKKLPRSLRV